jgi:hypothetical protein
MATGDAGKLWMVNLNTDYTFPGTNDLLGYRYEFYNEMNQDETIGFASGATFNTGRGIAGGPFEIIIPAGAHVVVIGLGNGAYLVYQDERVGLVS